MQNASARLFWSKDILNSVTETGQYIEGINVKAKLSFGMSFLNGTSILTPFGGILYSDISNNNFQFGSQFQLGSNLNFEFTGTQETNQKSLTNHLLQLDGIISW